MSRMVDTLIGGVFMVAAYTEEVAERIANWADELLIRRQNRTPVHPDGT